MTDAAAVQLCVIGGGKMGEAMVEGMLEAGLFPVDRMRVVEPDPVRRTLFQERFLMETLAEPCAAEVYLLAVKPQLLEGVLRGLSPFLPAGALLISIAAGISTEWIRRRIGAGKHVVRAMPNAAAVVRRSATALYLAPDLGDRERTLALHILESVGEVVVVDNEELLNTITGLSGSGPAYIFVVMEALTDAGVCLGLARETAAKLAVQTVLGSAEMARALDRPLALLKEIITSPGGTTSRGLKALESHAVRAAIMDAVEAAAARSRELEQE